jgi:hypothetical protein
MSEQNPNLIAITRPNVANPVPAAAESKFPTEVINLPSKGWFYPEGSTLSSGTLELKMMGAKEEDILTSKNLIQKNIVLDKLLESVIIDKSIKTIDMLICDRNAAFYALRRLAYGDAYEATVSCPRCSKENAVTIDLSLIDNKPFDFESFPKGSNSFEFELPFAKRKITFKLLSKKDEDTIDRELEAFAKISKEMSKEITTRLTHLITSVDGDGDLMKIRKFVNNELLSKDSLSLRKYIRENMPDIQSEFDFHCQFCDLERREETPMGVSFFWPNR